MANGGPAPNAARRALLKGIGGGFAALIAQRMVGAAATPFDRWIATFRGKAMVRGIAAETSTRVTDNLRPDTCGRTSEPRNRTGRQAACERRADPVG